MILWFPTDKPASSKFSFCLDIKLIIHLRGCKLGKVYSLKWFGANELIFILVVLKVDLNDGTLRSKPLKFNGSISHK